MTDLSTSSTKGPIIWGWGGGGQTPPHDEGLGAGGVGPPPPHDDGFGAGGGRPPPTTKVSGGGGGGGGKKKLLWGGGGLVKRDFVKPLKVFLKNEEIL